MPHDGMSVRSVLGDMPADELERALEAFASWVVSYRRGIRGWPVLPAVSPGAVAAALPAAPPRHGDEPSQWLADLDRLVMPAVTHWNHPGFMAYFGISGSGPGLLGELVAAALNTNGMLWKTCPALTELEQVVLRWYLQAVGLPTSWFGMLTDTASTSTLVALAAARHAAWPAGREEGLAGAPPLVLYCSTEAHSSVEKAGIVLGVGRGGVRRIPTDEAFRMRPELLEAAIREDEARGARPFAVVATVGTTSATAVDPVAEIAAVAHRHGLWLHVDAAYAGSAAVAEEFRWVLAGCQEADSLVTNPHKWLFTQIDCSALYTAHPETMRAALSLVPEYLRTDVSGATDLMDYSFQLGRRFRALKLWFVFRYFGTQGLASRIREHVRLARLFADWVDAAPKLERLAPVPLSVVCFRVHPPGVDEEGALEALNARVLERVNREGRVYLSHTKLSGRYSLRLAVGNLGTSEEDVRAALAAVERAAS
jgi:aromatic-L-amino-acid decarboxylase